MRKARSSLDELYERVHEERKKWKHGKKERELRHRNVQNYIKLLSYIDV